MYFKSQYIVFKNFDLLHFYRISVEVESFYTTISRYLFTLSNILVLIINLNELKQRYP